MKHIHKTLLFVSYFILNIGLLFGQIEFEQGYFIDNDNQRQDCLIKNLEWRNNPTQITYKLQENASIETRKIDQMKEFGLVNSYTRYIRANIEIDRSKDIGLQASGQREPEWSSETLFLKYIVDSELSLLTYWDPQVLRYFYQEKGKEIIQLVNKPFFIKGITELQWNHEFRQTLWAKLNCGSNPPEYYSYFNYDNRSLKKYFIQENKCRGAEVQVIQPKKKRDVINLKIAPGLKYANLDLQYLPVEASSVYFDQELSFRMGLELEYILPFNKNKWGMFVEPTFHTYQSEHPSDSGAYSVSYKSIEIPVGFRHYFFLSPQSNIFLNVAFVFDLALDNALVRFEGTPPVDLELNTFQNFDFGIGFRYAERFSAEFRYHTNRRMTHAYFWNSPYSGMSLIVGYTIL